MVVVLVVGVGGLVSTILPEAGVVAACASLPHRSLHVMLGLSLRPLHG